MLNKEIEIIRTHDEFYINVDPKEPPKDSFIQVASIIKNYKDILSRNISVADIGCAAGAFVNYLKTCFPEDKIVGYEYLETLAVAGRQAFPLIEINQGSVLDRNLIEKSHFDVVTLLGVLSIFDDIEPALSNVIYWTKPGGKIFIHGMFNPQDIDVFIKYRHSENYGIPEYEAGWNIVSQKTITKILSRNGARNIQFHEFNISIDLEKTFSDPLRSWTEKLENGKRQIINGLCLKQPQYIVEIDI